MKENIPKRANWEYCVCPVALWDGPGVKNDAIQLSVSVLDLTSNFAWYRVLHDMHPRGMKMRQPLL